MIGGLKDFKFQYEELPKKSKPSSRSNLTPKVGDIIILSKLHNNTVKKPVNKNKQKVKKENIFNRFISYLQDSIDEYIK